MEALGTYAFKLTMALSEAVDAKSSERDAQANVDPETRGRIELDPVLPTQEE